MHLRFRDLLVAVVSFGSVLGSTACGVVEPGTTYSIPRAVPTPTVAAKGMHFTTVTSGFFHTCALDSDGRAWCWGDNQYRQTGQSAAGVSCDETSTCTMTPALVETSLRFTAISAGTTSTCAIAVDESAWCWGGGYDAGRGMLGDGALTRSAQPVAVAGGIHFKSISAGGTLTCALSTDSKAYCWGRAAVVGDGGNANALSPHEVAGGYRFLAVAAGTVHACGVTTDRAMYCWGDNTSGALGDGTLGNVNSSSRGISSVPVRVATTLTFQSVVAGDGDTCGLTVSGLAACWGDNHVGEVGTGEPGPPVVLANLVSSSINFTAVSAGTAHTCGVDRNGTVQCWGGNWFGGLGDGTSTAANTGTERGFPKPISTSQKFTQIANGGSHTCALATDGRIWCWGDKARGQIGNG